MGFHLPLGPWGLACHFGFGLSLCNGWMLFGRSSCSLGLRSCALSRGLPRPTHSIGGKKVATAAEVRDAIGDAQKDGKRAVLIRLKSDNVTKFVAIRIAGA